MLVRPATPRTVAGVEALAESSLVAENIAQTLHVTAPDVTATPGEGGVLTVSVTAGEGERARQLDAEALILLTQLAPRRFTAPTVEVTVVDPAHVAEQTSPTLGRNLLIGVLGGLVLGLAATVALHRRRESRWIAGSLDPDRERSLEVRVAAVAKREAALARRAGELAATEQRLQEQGQLAAAKAGDPVAAEPEPPAQEPAPAPPVAETAPQAKPVDGSWTLDALERLVRDRRPASPGQAEEWDTYLFLLRQHATADGRLPPSFDALIADVFADAVSRS